MFTNKNNVLDLFCGCGGLSEGFKLSGFNIVSGIDFNAPAIATYQKNFPDSIGICQDLLEIKEDEIQQLFERIKKVDIIIGGPPCQGFSSANRYHLEQADPRNKLFFEFVKFVDFFKPKVVLIENVRGIVTRDNGYAKERIKELFMERGYKVSRKILDASDYGVPQRRLRNFFIMTKNKEFSFSAINTESHHVTVHEAIGELYGLEKETENKELSQKVKTKPETDYQKFLRSTDNCITNHDVRYPAIAVQERISYVPQGGNWKNVPDELWPTKRNNRHSSAYKRLSENEVSVTIDTGNNHSNYFHPIYNRIPTVREAARLQSFPDEFVFLGNRSEQYRQVGNAVPPLLAMHIAEAIKKYLE